MPDAKQLFFEEVLTSPYNHEKFIKFVAEFLTDFTPRSNALRFTKDSRGKYANFLVDFCHIGDYTTKDNKNLAIMSLRLEKGSNVEQARSKQRNYIKKIIRDNDYDAALVAFFTENDSDKWRLSFVKLDYEFAAGKISEKLTPAKRYSYLVGKDEPCNTAKQHLYPIYSCESGKANLLDLEDAFRVDTVTNEFFALYREKFFELQEILEGLPDFQRESKRCNFTSEQFAKKLLGQLVFLYFIQKKGWLGVRAFPEVLPALPIYEEISEHNEIRCKAFAKLYQKRDDGKYYRSDSGLLSLTEEEGSDLATFVGGEVWGTGPKNFIRKVFKMCKPDGHDFFDNYLEPLFYTALNNDRSKTQYYYHNLRCKVPFLNGGLFEALEGYRWDLNDFSIPNSFFSNVEEKGVDKADGVLDIFDRFNFTMNEEEPMECEVAIDPEMLGKVFENLLEIKDRKSKGAFYTPREIVHYMCQESLINYLAEKMSVPENDIRQFVLFGEEMKDEDMQYDVIAENKDMHISDQIYCRKTGVNRLKELDDLLANVKVCDPAVGSGAFPLGMVNEIVKARAVLTAYMAAEIPLVDKKIPYGSQQWQEFVRKNNSLRDKILSERNSYRLKRDTIGNSIFACDIMPSAVDIAKLRLWLAIAIDDNIANNNIPPRPLPNLDCNVICGNSLMDEFMGAKLLNVNKYFPLLAGSGQTALDFSQTDTKIEKLIQLQKMLYNAIKKETKTGYKQQIKKLRDEIIIEQLRSCGTDVCGKYYKAVETEGFRPFVVWPLYFPDVFAENGGFDIVIGNPPYVSTKGRKPEEKKALEHVFGFTDDLYSHFIFKGFDLLRNDGILSYITPDTYFTTITKDNLRKRMLENSFIKLVHLGHDIFEHAMVSTAICILRKSKCEYAGFSVIDAKGCKKLSDAKIYPCKQKKFETSMNKAFFVPNEFNNVLNDKFALVHTQLVNMYWDKIATSAAISKNKAVLDSYRQSLKPGDMTIVGLVSDGGVGLQTGNNGKYVGLLEGTHAAERTLETRGQKLAELNKDKKRTMFYRIRRRMFGNSSIH